MLVVIILYNFTWTEASAENKTEMRTLIEQKISKWKEYCKKDIPLNIKVRSDYQSSIYIYDNEPFREILQLGPPAVPYLNRFLLASKEGAALYELL